MRAERSVSMLSRVVTVARNAFGDSTSASERCRRRNASWTMSSASLTVPSMR